MRISVHSQFHNVYAVSMYSTRPRLQCSLRRWRSAPVALHRSSSYQYSSAMAERSKPVSPHVRLSLISPSIWMSSRTDSLRPDSTEALGDQSQRFSLPPSSRIKQLTGPGSSSRQWKYGLIKMVYRPLRLHPPQRVDGLQAQQMRSSPL